MSRNHPQHAGVSQCAQVADRPDTAEGENVRVFGPGGPSRWNTAEKNAGVTDAVALFEEFFDQRGRFAGALPPDDMIAGPDYRGEIKLVECDLLRHRVMAYS